MIVPLIFVLSFIWVEAQAPGGAAVGTKMDKSCFDSPRTGNQYCMGMLMPRYFFDDHTSRCVMRPGCYFSGFTTERECNKDCRCKQPPIEGHGQGAMCEQEVMVWMMVGETCMQRMYTGCGANGNNFKTQRECMSICKSREMEIKSEMPFGDMPFSMMMNGFGGPNVWGGHHRQTMQRPMQPPQGQNNRQPHGRPGRWQKPKRPTKKQAQVSKGRTTPSSPNAPARWGPNPGVTQSNTWTTTGMWPMW